MSRLLAPSPLRLLRRGIEVFLVVLAFATVAFIAFGGDAGSAAGDARSALLAVPAAVGFLLLVCGITVGVIVPDWLTASQDRVKR